VIDQMKSTKDNKVKDAGVKKPTQQEEDLNLILSAKSGDQMAYAKLLNRYRDSIYFVILKMVHNKEDAEDLCIEAFGKAFNNLEKYSPDYAFSTWLFRIAINNSIDFMRKKKLDTLSIDEPMESEDKGEMKRNLLSSNLDPEEEFIKSQRKKLMRDVTEKLNDKYRLLIKHRYFDELSYQEISEKMELPIGTVKAQLHRAKILLYNILRNSDEKFDF